MPNQWNLWRVRLRLESPLHVGFRRYGNLAQTRLYSPARLFWGAITARVARDTLHGDYGQAASWMDHNVRLSYFYPGGEDAPDFPWRDEAFAWKYLSSHVSTALVDGRSKADGSLHETEFLAPKTRAGKAVWLHGYLWRNAALDTVAEHGLRRALSRLQLGSERAYGWGRINANPVLEESVTDVAVGEWVFRKSRPEVVGGGPLLAHTIAMAELPTEPVVGRSTSERGFGSKIELLALAHPPGEFLQGNFRFEICNFGFWRQVIGQQGN